MKEAVIYGIVAISSLFAFAYTVHMFVGGLVEKETEHLIMGIVVSVAATVMAFMAWDVIKRRRAVNDEQQ